MTTPDQLLVILTEVTHFNSLRLNGAFVLSSLTYWWLRTRNQGSGSPFLTHRGYHSPARSHEIYMSLNMPQLTTAIIHYRFACVLAQDIVNTLKVPLSCCKPLMSFDVTHYPHPHPPSFRPMRTSMLLPSLNPPTPHFADSGREKHTFFNRNHWFWAPIKQPLFTQNVICLCYLR